MTSARSAVRELAALVLAACAVVLAGCASLGPPPALPPSHAVVDDATPLARTAAAGRPDGAADLSGFRLLPTGGFSFHARLDLVRAATRSVDAQYYLLQDDPHGRALLAALRDAAARGVRVRLLVDDLFAGREEDLFAGLAAHPNVEVRHYNPLPARRGSIPARVILSLHEFGRVNHRMHNKLLVADNAIAVTGGRNVGSEYFMADGRANFIDLDLLATGPVVRALSVSFDAFWNSAHVWPAERLAVVRRSPEDARAAFLRALGADPPIVLEPSADPFGRGPVGAELAAGRLTQTWAPARVLADPPEKAELRGDDAPPSEMMRGALAVIAAARSEVLIVSPYFIPGEIGMAMMKKARDDGVPVTVFTNAFGSNDVPLAHHGYARYRRDMLALGVRILELSATRTPTSGEFGNFGASIARLHAKAAAVDERYLFVGSMNLDGRSAVGNTELGVVVDSPALARELKALVTGTRRLGLMELRLTEDGCCIEWLTRDADGTVRATRDEPDATWWRRLRVWLLAPWIPEDLL